MNAERMGSNRKAETRGSAKTWSTRYDEGMRARSSALAWTSGVAAVGGRRCRSSGCPRPWPFSTITTSPRKPSGCSRIFWTRPRTTSLLVQPRYFHWAFTLTSTTSSAAIMPPGPASGRGGGGCGKRAGPGACHQRQQSVHAGMAVVALGKGIVGNIARRERSWKKASGSAREPLSPRAGQGAAMSRLRPWCR